MLQKLRNILFANFGAKTLALLIAIFAWTFINIKEKAFEEKNIRVPVELVNISKEIEVVSIQPEEVSLNIRGSSRTFHNFMPEELKIRIDLKDVEKSGRLYFYTRDFLNIPDEITILSLHPKMIEVNMEKLASAVIPIRARLRNKLKPGLKLKEVLTVPEKVTVFGYKNRIDTLTHIETEDIDISALTQSTVLTVQLKKPVQVLNIVDVKQVEVHLQIEKTTGESL